MTISEVSQEMLWAGGEYQVGLTSHEASHVAALAGELILTAPDLLDDQAFLLRARQLSCQLPISLLEAIRRYRHDPGTDGVLLISGLPIDEDSLPDTPATPDSVESSPTIPAAISLLIGTQLGEVIAYRTEKRGAMVQNVLPVPGMEDSQSNAGSQPLDFHVENAFHPHRPDYVGLLCLRSDHERVAGTLTASVRRALPLLSEADRDILSQPRFVTDAPPSFTAAQHSEPHPVLHGDPEDPDMVLDFLATNAPDDAKDALQRLMAALLKVAVPVVLLPGQMVFTDNRVVVHGRSLFVPRYDGRDRWLHRVYVSLDNRRSRPHRPANGAVLD